jgi:hypothetical protein
MVSGIMNGDLEEMFSIHGPFPCGKTHVFLHSLSLGTGGVIYAWQAWQSIMGKSSLLIPAASAVQMPALPFFVFFTKVTKLCPVS